MYILLLILLFIFVPSVFAASPPTLQNPANDSSTSYTSPTLSWEYSDTCPTSGNCFLVEVDNNDDFSSPEKKYYRNSLTYSPRLYNGKWYWRVKAKDSAGGWSEYSEARSFTIDTTQATLEPTPTPSSQSTPEPTPTPEPQTGPFLISNQPSSINSNESFNILVQLSNLDSNATYYIKVAFYKDGSSNYFGKTKVSGNWVKNSASAVSQYKITTDSSGAWAGDLVVMPDSSDTGFTGTGGYQFKVARYNSSGSGLAWSNSVSLTINFVPEPTPAQTSRPSTTTRPTSPPIAKPTSSSITASTASVLGDGTSNPQIASVAGISLSGSSSPAPESLVLESMSSINWWLIGSGITVIIGGSIPFLKNTSFVKLATGKIKQYVINR